MSVRWPMLRLKHRQVEVEKTVDEFGLGMLTAAGIGIAIHAAASAVAGKRENSGESHE